MPVTQGNCGKDIPGRKAAIITQPPRKVQVESLSSLGSAEAVEKFLERIAAVITELLGREVQVGSRYFHKARENFASRRARQVCSRIVLLVFNLVTK